jgi:iron complex outermembrane receptor protein
VRLPSRFDRDLRITGTSGNLLLAGSDDFVAEAVIAVEGGYRAQLTPKVSFDASIFSNDYDELRSLAPGGAVAGAVIRNELTGRSKGFELGVTAQAAPWLRAHASYTRLSTSTAVDAGAIDLGAGISEFNDPDHQATFRLYTDLPRGFELDGFLRYVSELPHPRVPAYGELDARLGWVSSGGHEFALVGRNLLHDQHPEFSAPGPRRYEFQRSVLLRSTWRF